MHRDRRVQESFREVPGQVQDNQPLVSEANEGSIVQISLIFFSHLKYQHDSKLDTQSIFPSCVNVFSFALKAEDHQPLVISQELIMPHFNWTLARILLHLLKIVHILQHM